MGEAPVRSFIGVSFGTFNSSIAIIGKAWSTDVIANEDGDRNIPSYVAFTSHEELAGSQAKVQAISNMRNTVVQFRSLLGKREGDEEVQEHSRKLPTRFPLSAAGIIGDDPAALSIRGIRLGQMRVLIDQWGGRDRLAEMSTTQVNEMFLKPMTSVSQLSWCEQFEKEGYVGDAEWFVSHAWMYKFVDVYDTLVHFFEGNESVILWFDLFSNSQHNNQAKPFEWWERTFMEAIRKIGKVVMVLHPFLDPIPLKRAWCIYEVYVTRETNSEFKVALSPAESDHFVERIVKNSEIFLDILSSIGCHKSTATNPVDREMIFNVIEKNGGFYSLDRLVLEIFQDWMEQKLMSLLDESREFPVVAALAGLYLHAGKRELAEPLFLECLEEKKRLHGDEHPDTLSAMQSLGSLFFAQGKYTDAEALFEICLEKRKEILGEDHVDSLMSMDELAKVHLDMGNYDRAEPLLTECLEKRRRVLGPVHRDTLNTMNGLAILYKMQARYELAETLFNEALDGWKNRDHPDALTVMSSLALLYKDVGNHELAELWSKEALKNRRRILGDDHPHTLISIGNLAAVYSDRGRFDAAEPLYVEAFEMRKKFLGADHLHTLIAMGNLVVHYIDQQQFDLAKPLALECLEKRSKTLGVDHVHTLVSSTNLGRVYRDQGEYKLAEPLFKNALSKLQAKLGDEHPFALKTMSHLALLYRLQKEYDSALPLYVECLEKRKKVLGNDHPDTLTTMNDLTLLYQELGMDHPVEPMLKELPVHEEARVSTVDRELLNQVDAKNAAPVIFFARNRFRRFLVKTYESFAKFTGLCFTKSAE
ncbi:Hsp70 protein-domain-containing protein [Cladochytrium replicatum]|nr:Hsp70 protein-domain-containing protein [Cladochytrium replicatum]